MLKSSAHKGFSVVVIIFLTANEIAPAIIKAQSKGYQVEIHAEGDRAVETVLKAAEKALAGEGSNFC